MASKDTALMAHLMRRAGFGASYDELERRAAKGYEATVEELLNPETQPDIDLDVLKRRYIEWRGEATLDGGQALWTYRMINSPRQLQEKVALFWHGILVVGNTKCEHARQVSLQMDMFRNKGMGNFRDLLLTLAQDPAMVFYLDNCMSHKGAINENWGRELLELFAMGVGMDGHPNYSEEDVKVAARAFTGWTITNAIPRYPYGRYDAQFVYNKFDHDYDEKTFLDQKGQWNGEDIIDIICRQPSAARFVARHLYNFFVADEPQVPAWQNTPPRDPEAIKQLEAEYFRSNYDIRSMLRVLFNSQWFKEARFAKVKSPCDVVAGTMRVAGSYATPQPGLNVISNTIRYMGQDLMNPPTVEGWHTGREWIDSGTLVERINFAANQVGNLNNPGIQSMVNRLSSLRGTITPDKLLDACLEMMGSYELPEETRGQLIDHIQKGGPVQPKAADFGDRVSQILQLIVATQEYQFA